MKLLQFLLSAFRLSLQQTLPAQCVKQNLSITAQNGSSVLKINESEYSLEKNVHIVAFGKAAIGMISGAESVLGNHCVDGIASAPIDSAIPLGLKTHVYTGAKNNLPDDNSISNTQKIVEYLQKVCSKDNQIILFLISGGGSALLSSPITGVSLVEKLAVIQTLVRNGADIKQLNIVRTALSTVKGGKLASFGVPCKMVSLIMSDIIGDPIDLISGGPTVLEKTYSKTVFNVFDELNVQSKISDKILNILQSNVSAGVINQPAKKFDVNNIIVGNNRLLLNNLAVNLRDVNASDVFIVTSNLEGDASDIGARFADFIFKCNRSWWKNSSEIFPLLKKEFQAASFNFAHLESRLKKRFVLLFGGETTVRFPVSIDSKAKGGRNQEIILSAFKRLVEVTQNGSELNSHDVNFALLSLGTDGEDGPTDATGAYITTEDVLQFKKNFEKNYKHLKLCLDGKNSYQFWSKDWQQGKNLVKFGKTGNNLMDVQILVFELLE